MANRFITIMEKIGHDIKVAFEDVVKYLPAASSLATLLFPGVGAIPAVVNAIGLIQQTVATVEQKFKAAGAPSGSGPQKLSQVLAIVGPSVTQLLEQEGLKLNQQQITNIINAVAAILNVTTVTDTTQPAPAPAA